MARSRPSPRRTARRRLAAVGAGVLLLGACGLDEQSQEVADQIRTAISGGNDSPEARDLATCTAERWVGETGVDQLRDDGLVTGEEGVVADNVRATTAGQRPVSRGTARAYARARVSCLDFDAEALESRQQFPGATGDQRDDYADCLKDVSTDLREDALTQVVLGNGQAEPVRRLDREVARCQESLG